MNLHPRVTRSVVELVKRFEGLRRHAAELPDNGWTIGYGHTRSAREGAKVSAADAEALLYYDLSEVAQKVEAWSFTPLNQNQFEALTALAFNIGLENFHKSTVLKCVNEGQHLQAASAFELWRKSDFGGEAIVMDALVRRRAAEKAHYLTPPEGFRPSPTPVLKPSFDYSGIEAAGAATRATDRFHHFSTDKRLEEPQAPSPALPPFEVMPDKPFGFIPDASSEIEVEAPPMPAAVNDEASQLAHEFDGVAPPFMPHVEALPSFGDATAPMTMQSRQQNEIAPRLDISPSSASIADHKGAPQNNRRISSEPVAAPRVDPRVSRTFISAAVGVLGGILFAAALVSMFSGKASPVNLVTGLIGIVLMTPAGGYFLLRFLKRKDASS